MLCCTILMISSRHHPLPGAGGLSKSYFLHNRLWKHCEHLIMRVIFGQEKGPKTKARSVGTIESLLLISEWHPRSLHFPPESHGWDADLIPGVTDPQDGDSPMPPEEDSNPSTQWLEDVVEPTRRSDRMSWMLMGCAISLAHELGIYEADKYPSTTTHGQADQILHRKCRIQKLLYVFHTQLASRLGHLSLMPPTISHIISCTFRSKSSPERTMDQWELFMDAWIGLTKIFKSVADIFFQSASSTQEYLLSGRYINLLENFRPLLSRWQEEYLESPGTYASQFFISR
jgi:hypothetical protein